VLDNCENLQVIKGILPSLKTFSAINCISLTLSCTSKFLNQVLISFSFFSLVDLIIDVLLNVPKDLNMYELLMTNRNSMSLETPVLFFHKQIFQSGSTTNA